MGLTLVEKIAGRHADGLAPNAVVRSGDYVSMRPRHVMTYDNTGAVIPKFKQIGAMAIADPAQPVFAIDHDIQNVSPKNLEKYAKIEAFAHEHGIDFYPAGTGISHQVMVERATLFRAPWWWPAIRTPICMAPQRLWARRSSGPTPRVFGQRESRGGKSQRSPGSCLRESFHPASSVKMSSSRCAVSSTKMKCSITPLSLSATACRTCRCRRG